GTLFLDELADLPVETQPKLLRAIQQGTFERLGSEKTVRADVRIICATNANIEMRIREGRFREDLFYRLNIFPIALPPLRQRKEDLVLLIHHFFQNLSRRFGYSNPAISEAAIQMLMQRSWPGNVRELENAVERALINSRGQMLEPLHFHFDQSVSEGLKKDVSPPEQLQDYASETRKIIEKALKICNGRIYGDKGAARLLNLKPTTLQSKMKKLRIEK
ncbi:MAG: sigma 54-interacting transcriptional regulator, partial [Candidatus Riflebacteria bacterium]